MKDINVWLDEFVNNLDAIFGSRVWFVGIQGSYARGEATSASDIDVVVILDKLTADDIKRYNEMLDALPQRELVCGFLSGKDEILCWEPSDLFQFYHDTRAIKGSLDPLLLSIDSAAVDRAVKIGACNIYHGCVHNMLHEKSEDTLRGLYKSASFVMQAVIFKRHGKYVSSQKALLDLATANEREIIETFISLKSGGAVDFDKMSKALFEWGKELIVTR